MLHPLPGKGDLASPTFASDVAVIENALDLDRGLESRKVIVEVSPPETAGVCPAPEAGNLTIVVPPESHRIARERVKLWNIEPASLG
jgi:hypothetical protein